MDGYFFLCDLKTGDGIKEIAVTESGPSGDLKTSFYYYDGKEIQFMGKVQGNESTMSVTGEGNMMTRTRGNILQTWFYPDQYHTNKEHRLENLPQDLYEMQTLVRVKKLFSLKKFRKNGTEAFDVQPGALMMITESDNKNWCLLEDGHGTQGWLEIEGYSTLKGTDLNAMDIFEGLSQAD